MTGRMPRLTPSQWAAALSFSACFLTLFWPTLQWMTERFERHDSFYSHGWLIPPAAAWLMWQRRAHLARSAIRPSYAGLALLAPALAIHVVAAWWKINFVSGFAMVVAAWGLVWTVWGRGVLRALRFPLLFLLFMVPLPGVLLIATSFHMKLFAATMATWCLNLMGMTAVQAGSTIQVPGVSVIVDDTCSGLRSLISLIALSTLWTALMPETAKRWQRLTIIAASIPIALIANMVRIIIMVYLTAIYGAHIADTILHAGSGVLVFGVALLVLAWLSRTVQQWSFPSLGLNR